MTENLLEPHTSQAQWDGVTKSHLNVDFCEYARTHGSLLCPVPFSSFRVSNSHSSSAWVGTKRSFPHCSPQWARQEGPF